MLCFLVGLPWSHFFTCLNFIERNVPKTFFSWYSSGFWLLLLTPVNLVKPCLFLLDCATAIDHYLVFAVELDCWYLTRKSRIISRNYF